MVVPTAHGSAHHITYEAALPLAHSNTGHGTKHAAIHSIQNLKQHCLWHEEISLTNVSSAILVILANQTL